MENTAQDNDPVAPLDLSVDNTVRIVSAWGSAGIVPEVAPGDDPSSSVGLTSLVAGNEEGEGLVPSENVFFGLGVEALVN